MSGDGGYNEVVDGAMQAGNDDVVCAVMAAGTMVSRLSGFLRSTLLAAALGTQLHADVFTIANTVPNMLYILLAGGVSANARLRAEMSRVSRLPVRYPPLSLCTDNAAMIAAAGSAMYLDGIRGNLAMNGKPGMPLESWKSEK